MYIIHSFIHVPVNLLFRLYDVMGSCPIFEPNYLVGEFPLLLSTRSRIPQHSWRICLELGWRTFHWRKRTDERNLHWESKRWIRSWTHRHKSNETSVNRYKLEKRNERIENDNEKLRRVRKRKVGREKGIDEIITRTDKANRTKREKEQEQLELKVCSWKEAR